MLRAADELRIATTPLDAAAEVYYAADQGFFREAGIDARIETFASGAVIAPAIAAGTFDIGFASLISVAAAFAKNVPFTIVAPGSLYVSTEPTTVLMVPKSSTLEGARDLNGKTLAASLGTISHYAPRLWIDKNGGDSSTVKFVEMSQPNVVAALGSNRIDAAIVAEPFISEAKPVARVFSNAFDAVGSHFAIGVWFTTAAWARGHADQVRRFQQALAKTAAWANGHRPQSALILAKYGKLDPAVTQAMSRVSYAVAFDRNEMQPVIDLTAQFGGIPRSFPIESMLFAVRATP